MNHDDSPDVMMLHLEEVQLFFLAHPDGGCRNTDIQLIRQVVKNLREFGYLYIKALGIWNAKDPAHQMVWTNFTTTMYKQYERVLAERGGGTLVDDGYNAFNVSTAEDTTALTESIVRYAEHLARSNA